jgi:hypothetical protein
MAPLSTYMYPNALASCFANVLLPVLDQPSIVTIIFFMPVKENIKEVAE